MSSPVFPIRYPIGAAEPLLTLSKGTFPAHPTLHNGEDSRLTRALIEDGLRPSLDAIEREWRGSFRAYKAAAAKDAKSAPKDLGAGAVVIVGRRGQEKFFSNGFDYASVISDPNWFALVWNPFLVRLLSFPLPTVAAINGHCFAAGFVLSMACDYRILLDPPPKRNLWLSMNEIHFGAPYPPSFGALLRAKLPSAATLRTLALEGHRWTPPDAIKAGIVDELVSGGTEIVLERAVRVGSEKAALAREGAWGLIRAEIYRPVIQQAQQDLRPINVEADDAAAKAKL
ncbi:hypothetical protein EWM64_g3356 [Hericium alpestre]|uniref:Enoyl-CoA hydratase n=1 Tax=Hericium alpestre TaxID=135208 RepID=A0A4Z0A451_9AGAM|nr:hypothetical protein EWM64_g3356 [Hericium alpestre]